MVKNQTRKPCHGCGETGWREIDKLCFDCQKLLNDAKRLNDSLKQDPNMQEFQLPWRSYSMPHITHVYSSENDLSDKFQQTFFELINLLVIKSSDGKVWFSSSTEYLISESRETEGKGFMNQDVRRVLNELYKIVREISLEAFNQGQKDGRSFLAKLASGEISIDTFNKITIGENK